jgi:hypothetical protein
MQPDEQVQMGLDRSERDYSRTLLLGDRGQESFEKTRDPGIDQPLPISGRPGDMNIQSVTHDRI